MKIWFSNWTEFLAMGKYGVFIWSSLAVVAVLWITFFVTLARYHRNLHKQRDF